LIETSTRAGAACAEALDNSAAIAKSRVIRSLSP
jgi:hypothetical protein